MLKKEESREIIQQAYDLLESRFAYSQVIILRKLKTLGTEVSTSTLSNILKGKNAGKDTLLKLSQGMQQILTSELGLEYNSEKKAFSKEPTDPNWEPIFIAEGEPEPEKKRDGVIFHKEGRLSIPDKVEFMVQAKKEIVEVGVRLRTFTEYFTTRREEEFSGPIAELLQKGVNMKLYVLDPESQESRFYFNDRGKVQPGEEKSPEVALKAIEEIKQINEEFSKRNYKGKIEVYCYRHIPYNHFLIIDGFTEFGQMMVSSYLYGIKRADCPVIEISKAKEPKRSKLYSRYWTSYELLTANARRIL